MNSRLTTDARDLVSSLSTPVFLAGFDAGRRPRVTLHTARPEHRRALLRELASTRARSGRRVRYRVKHHDSAKLARIKSLDRLLQRFDHQMLLSDPTGCVTRARSLVRCARELRRELDEKLLGLYLEPWHRTLYVVLDPSRFICDAKLQIAELRAVELAVATAVHRSLGDEAGEPLEPECPLQPFFRVGFEMPPLAVVPLDHASAPAPHHHGRLRSASIAASLTALLGIGTPSSVLAEGPAVSEVNAKITARGGVVESDGAGSVSGALAFPIGERFGGQIESIGGVQDGDGLWGAAAHLFWRDPEQGLLGLIGSHSSLDDIYMSRVGAEGELYLDRFSILASGGYQFGDVESGAFGRLDLRWYAGDNLMFTGGAEKADEVWVTRIGAEYQPGFAAFPGLALFADGEKGKGNYDALTGGFRFYFGAGEKSLIDRHRKDDPANLLPGSAFALRNELSVRNELARRAQPSYGS